MSDRPLLTTAVVPFRWVGRWSSTMMLAMSFVAVSLPEPGFAEEGELPPAAKRKVDFEKDVHPLFVNHCYECHGPTKQESGLRLDRKNGPHGDSGKSIVSGKSAESLLVQYVAGLDPDTVMPPDGKKFTDEQVGLIRAWIDQGAERPDDKTADNAAWSKHWSFQPIRRPALPAVSRPQWGRNPIDAFVLARLDKAGIAPSPETDRATLIRRLSLDLVGLPPSMKEVDAFVADDRPEAYEELVDRLLASPHFGERWGRHWLDLARYADSDGYEKDNPRLTAWKYRDWVIEAFNQDMPFDQFTIEQLAGDLLPNATASQRLATAFHRQTLTNTEGGTDQEQFRNEACFDRVSTTATAWLGLTVGCAQCHSHKYDPITQTEYYQIFAFFNNGDESSYDYPNSEAEWKAFEKAKSEHDAAIKPLVEKRNALRDALSQQHAEWETELKARLSAARKTPIVWHDIAAKSLTAASGASFEKQADQSYLVVGAVPESDDFTITAKVAVAEITGARLDVLADDRLPSQGPGRAPNGNFVLGEFKVSVSETEAFEAATQLKLERETADYTQPQFSPTALSDGNPKTGWAIGGQVAKNHFVETRFSKPWRPASEGSLIRFVLDQNYGGQHTIGRFRLRVSTGVDVNDIVPADVAKALDVAEAKRTAEQKNLLIDHQLRQSTEGRALLSEIASLTKKAPVAPVIKVAVITQRTSNPRITRLLRRGDFLQPQAEVRPGALSILHEFEARGENTAGDRLDLARWLVDPSNPLTPRVAVNHVWLHLFGRGIVATVNDFGTRGDPPSHPQLLDWLAAEFAGVDDPPTNATSRSPASEAKSSAWSRKALIKRIVMSATYRQSSVHRPDVGQIDPDNHLLHRQNRLRVEAEIVRDLHLAAAGLLSRKVGGPSVFPPLPPDVAALSYANNFKWTNSTGEDRYRRGMYTFFKRTSPYPNLVAFDCPDGVTTAAARTPSNTPLQALATMNNEVFVETAQALAARILSDADVSASDAARVDQAFQIALSRKPVSAEQDQMASLVESARDYYRQHPEDAAKLSSLHRPKTVPAEETAAWIIAARVILNFDEFVTRE